MIPVPIPKNPEPGPVSAAEGSGRSPGAIPLNPPPFSHRTEPAGAAAFPGFTETGASPENCPEPGKVAPPEPVCFCGAPLFRGNTVCLRCGSLVGFLPDHGWRVAFNKDPDGTWSHPHPLLAGRRFKLCAGRNSVHLCNWMISAQDPATLCLSCSLTRTWPDLSRPGAADRWAAAERAKRQTIVQLLRLRLPVRSRHTDPDGVWFDFLEPLPGGPPIMTAHDNGLITLNLIEADPAQRAVIQERMGESYRTLTGHLRHELAHYYWQVFTRNPQWLDFIRPVFGDDRIDYNEAIARYHRQGPNPNWSSRFISPYASSHPWEDWAETFAHYLHMEEGLHTARVLGLDLRRLHLRTDSFAAGSLQSAGSPPLDQDFLEGINRWVLLALTANELNAALGHPFAYPFVLNAAVVAKLHTIHQSFQQFAAPADTSSVAPAERTPEIQSAPDPASESP